MKKRSIFLAVLFSFSFALVSSPQNANAEKPRILYVSQSAGFVHGSVRRNEKKTGKKFALSELAMMQLAQKSGAFTVDLTQDCASDFTKKNLQNYDIVMFYTTGALPIAEADKKYFIDTWLKQKGHGFIGIHSAMDTYRAKPNTPLNEQYRWYWEMVGGSFSGHPWNSRNTVTIKVHEPDHPTMKPFGTEYVIKDEIYQYINWQPEKVRVLMSLDMAKCDPKMPYHVPVAWCKNWGEGKVYCNNLGHNGETWANPDFQKSIVNAAKWIRGDLEGSAEPNPKVSKAHHEKSIKDASK